jgi:hypothetical protein
MGLEEEVIEWPISARNGRHDWIRTSDLFRVKEAL